MFSDDSSMVRCTAILIPVSRLGYGRTGFSERSPHVEGKNLDTSTPYLYNRELGLMSFDYSKEEIGQWFDVEPYWKDVNPNNPRPKTGAIHGTILKKATQKVEVEALVTNGQRYNYYNGIAIVLNVEESFMTLWNDNLGIIIHFGSDLIDKFSSLQPVNFKATPVCEHRFSAFSAVKVSAAKLVKLSHLSFCKNAVVEVIDEMYPIAKCENGDQVLLLDERRALMPPDSVEDGMEVCVAYYRIQLHDGAILVSAYITNDNFFEDLFEVLCNGRKINDEHFSDLPAASSSSAPRRSPQDLKNLLDEHFAFFDIDNTDMQWLLNRAHIEVAESVSASRFSGDGSVESEDEREMEERRKLEVTVIESAADPLQEVVHIPQKDNSSSSEEESAKEEVPPAAHTAVSDSGTFIISKEVDKKDKTVDDSFDDEFGSIPDIDLDIENVPGTLPGKRPVYNYAWEEEFLNSLDGRSTMPPRVIFTNDDNKENIETKATVPAPVTCAVAPRAKPMTRLSNPLQNNAPGVPKRVARKLPKSPRQIMVNQAKRIVWDNNPPSTKASDFEKAVFEFFNTKEAEMQNIGTPLSRNTPRVHPGLDNSIPSSFGAPSPVNNFNPTPQPNNCKPRESPLPNNVSRKTPETNSHVVETNMPISQGGESARCSPEMTNYHSARGSPYSISSVPSSGSPVTVPQKAPTPVGQPLGMGGAVPSSMRGMIRTDWPPRTSATPSPNSGGRPPSATAAPVGERNTSSRLSSTSQSSTNGEGLRRTRNESGSSSSTAGAALKFGPMNHGESYDDYIGRTMGEVDTEESRNIRFALNAIYASSKMRDIVMKYFPGIQPIIKKLFEKPTEINISVLERFKLQDIVSSGSAFIDRITLENQVYRLIRTTSPQMWHALVQNMPILEEIHYLA